jgi:hypothetical protein
MLNGRVKNNDPGAGLEVVGSISIDGMVSLYISYQPAEVRSRARGPTMHPHCGFVSNPTSLRMFFTVEGAIEHFAPTKVVLWRPGE